MVNWIYDVLLWLFSGTEKHGGGMRDGDANTVCLGDQFLWTCSSERFIPVDRSVFQEEALLSLLLPLMPTR